MTSDAAGGHVRGWRFVARIAAAVFLVAVTWMGFTTIGEDANLDCGTALAPDYSALPDDGSEADVGDAFDAESFAVACRDDIATQRFLMLLLAIAGTAALVIGMSNEEQVADDLGSPDSAES